MVRWECTCSGPPWPSSPSSWASSSCSSFASGAATFASATRPVPPEQTGPTQPTSSESPTPEPSRPHTVPTLHPATTSYPPTSPLRTVAATSSGQVRLHNSSRPPRYYSMLFQFPKQSISHVPATVDPKTKNFILIMTLTSSFCRWRSKQFIHDQFFVFIDNL